MLLESDGRKCELCDKKSKYVYYNLHYCKRHYLKHIYNCSNIQNYIKENKMVFQMHSDGETIILKRNNNLIEFCVLLGMVPDEDYWFGKGRIGNTDLSNTMFIKGGKDGRQ